MIALAALATLPAHAASDGVALTPPMGWRSWNFYACEVSQAVIERQVAALVDRSRAVDGVPTSLLDLGYDTVGIDDCWQDCLHPDSLNGSYHSASGEPLVDTAHFPDLRALSDKATAAGVMLGWYGNNCPETSGPGRGPKYCSEHGKLQPNWPNSLHGDVAALLRYNFSSIKLDNPGCGAGNDMQAYYDLVSEKSPRGIVIENCHYNTSFPFWADRPGGRLVCPMHLYRVSNDIKANWQTIMANAHATIPYADTDHPMSQPGCWAYPDMLEVGVTGQNGKSEGGLTFEEQRTHFGLWCVVSSPLTLSFDLGDSDTLSKAWPIVTNREALAVSQSYHGHPGTLLDEDKDTAGGTWQVWGKPQAGNSTAILFINTNGVQLGEVTISLTAYGGSGRAKRARDVWARKDLAVSPNGWLTVRHIDSHDSRFLIISDA